MDFLFYFEPVNYINLNGKIQAGDEPALLVSNRGYRYGDGLFETIKVINGNMLLQSFHFERLFAGLSLLQFDIPKLLTAGKLVGEILHLCQKNRCEQQARVRLSVFRGQGGLYDEDRAPQYVMECMPLDETGFALNENGLVVGLYQGAKKNCDVFSNLKSANFLPYTMAALHAKEKKWNDCLVLNTNGHIADSTIANVFIIKDGVLVTPALSEGCVNGVMRRYVIEKLRTLDYSLREDRLSVNDLEAADEVFLTNAIKGIRWVRQFADTIYTNPATREIFNRVIKTISA